MPQACRCGMGQPIFGTDDGTDRERLTRAETVVSTASTDGVCTLVGAHEVASAFQAMVLTRAAARINGFRLLSLS